MTDDERKRLRELAEAATPGEWWLSENDGCICSGPDGPDAIEVGNSDFSSADTLFVLAANPTTVLSLLDDNDRLRAEVSAARAPEAHWECQQRVDALEQQLTAMTRARDEACDIAQGWFETETQYPTFQDDPGWRRIAELRKVGT